MSKYTYNRNVNFNRLQTITCPNSNPNPNSSHFSMGNARGDVLWKNHQQLPSFAPPEAAFSSITSVPANSYGYRYITFRVSSYTRRELKELKGRLTLDLERVRVLRQRICSTAVPKKSYHPPQMETMEVPVVDSTVIERPKSAVGQKRTKPPSSVRDTKKQCNARVKNNSQKGKVAMRKCGQILTKLMKHKHGWVFNTPVDAAALKLYNYHTIINNPMDLGTIKSKLSKNEYESPLAFASDVRLTFQNAMVYNGKGSEVFVMAERLLFLFEDLFNPIHQKLIGNQTKKQNSSTKIPVEKPIPNPAAVFEKPVSNPRKSNHVTPVPCTPIANIQRSNKPEMTAEEKSELAAGLQNLQLGPEGMDQIMAITKKGVSSLQQEGDEIELDLGVLDDETLWELHNFIGTSRKKSITDFTSSVQANNSPEEDIDIGEDIPITNFPFLEIEKDGLTVSSSSTSSSSSGSESSSSDSDGSSGEGN